MITEVENQRKMQGDEGRTLQQSKAAQNIPQKAPIETSNERHYGKGEKAIWRVKDKTNFKENTKDQNKEEGEHQTNTNSKEKTGQIDNLTPNKHDPNNLIGNNSHKSQNEYEKCQSVVQAGVITIEDQSRKTTHKGIIVDSKIPPPIKVSTNFDIYRPNQQRTTQTSPKHNQNKLPGSTFPTRNVNHQIPDPAPPTVTQSLATRLRAIQIKNATPLDIITPIITT
ncbi:hypothetical protein R3W88_024471 [Solanum pinnatisectum]|uniref:Uncharacterized protein n=1 Tax=Solanum pinnatisectum TaxID=50273 RepID=A0AAV9M099_9SOLN|nr:hypothetical protein R3W88_024471 [Solanum pinnatisectum]